MSPRKDVNWTAWSLYYVGRGLELGGLFFVTAAMVLYFGTSEMRPMLAMTGVGGGLFFVGWLLAHKNPGGK